MKKLCTHIIFLCLISSCASSYETKKDVETQTSVYFPLVLTRNTWEIKSMCYPGNRKIYTPTSYRGSMPSLSFSKDQPKAGGWSGCNSYSVQVRYAGSLILFREIMSTRRGCPPGGLEHILFEALLAVNRYEIRGKDLYLMRDREILIILSVYPPPLMPFPQSVYEHFKEKDLL